MELYDEELDYEVYKVGLHTLRELEPIASGPQAMLDRITEVTGELLAHGKFVVGVGGEHTISFGIVRAFAERFRGCRCCNSTLMPISATPIRGHHTITPACYAASPKLSRCTGRHPQPES